MGCVSHDRTHRVHRAQGVDVCTSIRATKRNAPEQFWRHIDLDLDTLCELHRVGFGPNAGAKTALCTIPRVASVRFVPKLKDTRIKQACFFSLARNHPSLSRGIFPNERPRHRTALGSMSAVPALSAEDRDDRACIEAHPTYRHETNEGQEPDSAIGSPSNPGATGVVLGFPEACQTRLQ